MSGTEFIEGAIHEMHAHGPLAGAICRSRCPKCSGTKNTCVRVLGHNGLHQHRESRFTTEAHSWGTGR